MKLFKFLFIFIVSSVAYSQSFTPLTASGSNAATTSFATASITPGSGNLVLIAVGGRLSSGNGPQPLVSITGASISGATNWDGVDYGSVAGTAKNVRLELWCALGTGSAGALTITFSTNPTGVNWSVDQSANAAKTCAAAKGNIFHASFDVATASPLSVTMTSFLNSASSTYAAGSLDGGGIGVSQGSGFTELGPATTFAPSNETEYSLGHVSPATTTYTGGPFKWAIIGAEIIPAQNSVHKPLSF